MSDTASKGGDLLLPSLMISAADGEELLRIWREGAGASDRGGASGPQGAPVDINDATCQTAAAPSAAACLWGHASARDHRTSCAVCLMEFQAEELATRLPCAYLFHEDCVRTWLKKNHTCPTCRKPLPTNRDTGRAESAEGG